MTTGVRIGNPNIFYYTILEICRIGEIAASVIHS